jgi:hypothetical protein
VSGPRAPRDYLSSSTPDAHKASQFSKTLNSAMLASLSSFLQIRGVSSNISVSAPVEDTLGHLTVFDASSCS